MSDEQAQENNELLENLKHDVLTLVERYAGPVQEQRLYGSLIIVATKALAKMGMPADVATGFVRAVYDQDGVQHDGIVSDRCERFLVLLNELMAKTINPRDRTEMLVAGSALMTSGLTLLVHQGVPFPTLFSICRDVYEGFTGKLVTNPSDTP